VSDGRPADGRPADARPASERLAAFAKAVVALRAAAPPRAAMLRSGGAIGIGFVAFLALGSPEQAVVCAFFTNFLCFADKASDLPTRIWVQLIGALLCAGAGALGVLVAGNPPMIMLTTFVVALFAGFVHGSTPGVEAIPRYALVSLLVSAFLPVGNAAIVLAIVVGTALSLAAVLLDDHIRHGRRGIRIARMKAAVTYPGPRFSLVFGMATAAGLALGLAWITTRPYWIALTTVLVMQPDRRANTIRVMQRFLGTLAGVLAAFLLVLVVPTSARSHTLLLLAVALPFVWPLGFDRNYGLGVAILSAWVLVLIDTALPPGEPIGPLFLARLSNTALGCAVALAGSFVVYETDAELADEAEA
jgi:Fusaric acid resistance protein-like